MGDIRREPHISFEKHGSLDVTRVTTNPTAAQWLARLVDRSVEDRVLVHHGDKVVYSNKQNVQMRLVGAARRR